MDAFGGFVRGFRENQRISVFSPSKWGRFPANFQPPLGREKNYFARPLFWLSPPRSMSDSSKTAGLHSRQVHFLIGAKAVA